MISAHKTVAGFQRPAASFIRRPVLLNRWMLEAGSC
jgi:hypothetical protein